ncbi:MAG: hypothetical protein JW788_03640 [Candidatus Omnitrophica bacterium]|nr:hypothetical protein [Candidatus Omnitrophota bacterium]
MVGRIFDYGGGFYHYFKMTKDDLRDMLRKYYLALSLSGVFIFAVSICLYYGKRGINPMDHFIVFDGAWRVLCGQIPLRDFNTPNGIVPILLQALFFKLFGINWFVYCLSAALFNGLFSLCVFFVLRLLNASRAISLFYSLLSGIIFYPPVGVPFMEQHSFFFILLALAVALVSGRAKANGRSLYLAWFFVPFIFSLAYFSKQIPAVFSIPVLVFIFLFMPEKRSRARMLISLLAGAIFTFCLILISYKVLPIDPLRLKVYFMELPYNIGLLRAQRLLHGLSVLQICRIFFYPHYLLSGSIVRMNSFVLVYAGFIIALIIKFLKKSRASGLVKEAFLSIFLLVICNLFIAFTLHQIENGIPYLFLSLGIIHNLMDRSLISAGFLKHRQLFRLCVASVFFAVAIFDAAIFNERINNSRMVNSLSFTRDNDGSRQLPSELRFMSFSVPFYWQPMRARDLRDVCEFFKNKEDNFFLFGDFSVLYALTKRPSVNPSLWFHGGLTIPGFNSDRFTSYEDELLHNFKKLNVKYVVIENEGITFSRVKLTDFSRLNSFIGKNTSGLKDFGWFKIIRLKQVL